MVKKIKDLLLSIFCLIGIRVVFSDLGLPSFDKTICDKYLLAVPLAIFLVFYIKPRQEKERAERVNR
ncbi:MAG: hypothetical protein C5B59_16205 [Bacteroidetes bacterium]|nr:MAG: hypothetical protein C5B59_16205 [Bacteroidota bacterium]